MKDFSKKLGITLEDIYDIDKEEFRNIVLRKYNASRLLGREYECSREYIKFHQGNIEYEINATESDVQQGIDRCDMLYVRSTKYENNSIIHIPNMIESVRFVIGREDIERIKRGELSIDMYIHGKIRHLGINRYDPIGDLDGYLSISITCNGCSIAAYSIEIANVYDKESLACDNIKEMKFLGFYRDMDLDFNGEQHATSYVLRDDLMLVARPVKSLAFRLEKWELPDIKDELEELFSDSEAFTGSYNDGKVVHSRVVENVDDIQFIKLESHSILGENKALIRVKLFNDDLHFDNYFIPIKDKYLKILRLYKEKSMRYMTYKYPSMHIWSSNGECGNERV